MVARVFGDHHRGRDAADRIGMLLERRIPEIFRKVLLTNGKADRRRFGITRKRKRERDLGPVAVG